MIELFILRKSSLQVAGPAGARSGKSDVCRCGDQAKVTALRMLLYTASPRTFSPMGVYRCVPSE